LPNACMKRSTRRLYVSASSTSSIFSAIDFISLNNCLSS